MTQTTIPLDRAQYPVFAGIDVGGTSIKLGLVDDNGRTVGFDSIPTDDEQGPDDAIRRMRQSLDEILVDLQLDWSRVASIGLGTPGTMDIPAGMVLEPPNMPGWRHFPIRDRLSEICDKPVSFANDAGAAAFGESWVGSGQEFHSIVMLTLGTGVGGGIIIGDRSLDGENSHGSECGHIIIDSSPTARICSCGQHGHLEAYASATAVIRRTEEALEAGRQSSLAKRRDAGEPLSGLMLAEEAASGDHLALEIIDETADYIAVGVASMVHTIDPGAVILGGAMTFGGQDSELGRRFLSQIDHHVRQIIFPVQAERLSIRFASLGSDAGYIGAAGIARVAYHRDNRETATCTS